ncbi:MAG: hypothetical protein LBQ44_10575 [Treponema sp.]|jgi:hypothetical protein|nr:hypothetical protein [Treponema sp.]
MEFENSFLSRDFLYLCALFAGAGTGSVLSIFKRRSTLRSRSAFVSAALLFFSGAAAFFTAAVIFSRGALFSAHPLYMPAGLIAVLGALAVRFPPAGVLSVLIAGLFAVWIGLFFLRYPPLQKEKPEALSVYSSKTGIFIVRRYGAGSESWNIRNDGNPLQFEAAALAADYRYPLLGGERRGLIIRAARGGETLFSAPLSKGGPAEREQWRPGFTRRPFSLTLSAGELLPGMGLSVLFDGEDLYFDPPVEFP